jgi:N-acetylmuramoyl-L-alanine amidase
MQYEVEFGGVRASDVVDRLAARVEGRLAALGTTVLLTRPPLAEASAQLAPADRAEFANRINADLVVSIHIDTHANPHASGVATFYYGGDRFGAFSILGQRAADLILSEALERTDLRDCRSHAKTWALLRLTRMPTVRVECGYLSNPADRSRLRDDAFIDTLAESIALGVVRYFSPVEGE